MMVFYMRRAKIYFSSKISLEAQSALQIIANSRKKQAGLVLRSRIILKSLNGEQNKDIASSLNIHYNTVGKWQNRFYSFIDLINFTAENDPEDLEEIIINILSDKYRSGAPLKYSNTVRCTIVTIACQSPRDYGVEASNWTLELLRVVLIANKVVDNISKGEIWHILESNDIKPWKSQYYLHSKEKYENPETYNEKVDNINDLYEKASNNEEPDLEIVCVDEMTGVQALERKYPDKPTLPGKPAQYEFEYIRHGCLSIIGGFNVRTGNVIEDLFSNQTRKNDDFVEAISRIYNTDTDKRYAFICDNLNIHSSEELVRFVAKAINYNGDLGKKGKYGILKDLNSRTEFLTDKSHKIYFNYTPIHCSWMNQIEIWFGIINKHLLKRSSYKSIDELEKSIKTYIKQYNKYFAHRFNWKYKRCDNAENA